MGARPLPLGVVGVAVDRKQAICIADSLEGAHKLQTVLASLDVGVVSGTTALCERMLAQHPSCDLVILEGRGKVLVQISQIEKMLLRNGCAALLVILDNDQLVEYRPCLQVKNDFIVKGASAEECSVRIAQLLWPHAESSLADYLTIDAMTINLATYQVKVSGEPLDLTYLEYALLAFLVTHSNHTFSRDVLLRRVWGFEYYGGSRTVDVHVRRVRAKLGAELAQRLTTVRGVGYLWIA